MQLREFSGGVNTRVDPSLLDSNEGVIYRNIDNTSKIMKSVREPKEVEDAEAIFGYFYNFTDTWLSSTAQRSYIEYKNTIYWTENTKKPQKFDGGRTSQMGIIGPSEDITVTSQNPLVAPVLVVALAETTPVGDGVSSDGTTEFCYHYSYYDSVQNRESGVYSTSSAKITPAINKDVLISDIVASAEDGVDVIRIYRDDNNGMPNLTLVLEVPNTSDNVIDSKKAEDISPIIELGDVGISGDAETLQYVYTYYNSQDGVESVASSLSPEIALAANKEVLVGNIKASDDIQVDKIRLYRTGDGATQFTLIFEYPNEDGDIIDATATIDADGRLYDGSTNYPPPVDGRFLTEAYGIMFMAVGSSLHFSTKGKPDYYPVTNVIDFANDITGMFPVPNGLLVFSKTNTSILLGTEAGNFSVLPVSSEHGSISHYSGKLVKNVPTWVGLDGICNYISGVVRVVSKDKLGKISLTVINSAVYDEIYWLCLSDGTLFIMDTRFGKVIFRDFEFSERLDNILTYNDTLYGRQGDKLVTLLDGLIARPMDYLSPVLTEGEHTNTKNYNNIYIKANSTGEYGLEICIFIDGKLVHQKTLRGNKVFDITLPAEKQRGSNIQFGIKGVGEIYEISYKVLGRSNGR